MKKLIFFVACCLQAQFPSNVPNLNYYGGYQSGTNASLALPINITDTSITVRNGTCFAFGLNVNCLTAFSSNMLVNDDGETMQICSVVAGFGQTTVLNIGHSSCPNIDGRAFGGTTAAQHFNIISSQFTSYSYNKIINELQSIEGAILGIYNPTVSSFATQCAAAVAANVVLILNGTQALNLPTQSIPCNLNLVSGGSLQPGVGQTLTPTGSIIGDLTQHFDLSLSGLIDLSQATIATLYPQWFGATCGTADSTVGLQNTFNVRSGAPISITCRMTTTSVYLPSYNGGIMITGNGLPSIGVSGSPVGGLIAKNGTTGALLAVYAEKPTISNLMLDCNHQCANPLLLVEAQDAVLTSVFAINGTSSGQLIWNEGSPQTLTTSTITGGVTTSFTVANAALPGYPLSGTGNVGGSHCGTYTIGLGGANTENLGFSVSGNTITSAAPVHSYPIGTPIQCHGNDNSMTLTAPLSANNGGPGIDMMGGADVNSIAIIAPVMFGNTGCGILGSGSVNKVVGGSYEGNTDCMIQLGDANGGRQTVEWEISTQDTESVLPAVVSVCDIWSTYHFTLGASLVFAGTSCPQNFQATMGWGYGLIQFGNIPEFIFKSIDGIMFMQLGKVGWQNYDSRIAMFSNGSAVISASNGFIANQQVIFYEPDGVMPANFTPNHVYFVSATGLSDSQFEVSVTVGGSPIVAGSAGSGTQRVGGLIPVSLYNSTGSTTGATTDWIPPNRVFETFGTVNTSGTSVTWVSGAPFGLNWVGYSLPINGVIYTVASVTSTTSLTLTSSAGTQSGVVYGSANNLLVVNLLDAVTGVAIPLNAATSGMSITILLSHSLAAGSGNSIIFNGAVVGIFSAKTTFGGLTNGWSASSVLHLDWNNSVPKFSDPSQ